MFLFDKEGRLLHANQRGLDHYCGMGHDSGNLAAVLGLLNSPEVYPVPKFAFSPFCTLLTYIEQKPLFVHMCCVIM